MKKAGTKNGWVLLLMMLSGIVLGSFVAMLTEKIPAFAWLSYGQSFGFDKPIVLDLGILVITFGLSIKITIGSIIGLLLAAVIYKFI